MGRAVCARADVVRPGGDDRDPHAVLLALRDPRRAGQAHAGQSDGAEPEFAWHAPLHAYDPRRAKQLLVEAGYPNGFDAGAISTDTSFAESAEPIAGYFAAIGVRATVRSLERVAFFNQLRDKKLRPLAYAASGAYGNAATRLDAFVAAGGAYAYGSYPDIEGSSRNRRSTATGSGARRRCTGSSR